jgi:hypothetical protein
MTENVYNQDSLIIQIFGSNLSELNDKGKIIWSEIFLYTNTSDLNVNVSTVSFSKSINTNLPNPTAIIEYFDEKLKRWTYLPYWIYYYN